MVDKSPLYCVFTFTKTPSVIAVCCIISVLFERKIEKHFYCNNFLTFVFEIFLELIGTTNEI
jgi:hypothetical protein